VFSDNSPTVRDNENPAITPIKVANRSGNVVSYKLGLKLAKIAVKSMQIRIRYQ
jgi:hypothetical protein